MRIEFRDGKWVLLAEDGSVLHEAESELEVTEEQLRRLGEAQTESEPILTSADLNERPFLIDGVALGESQIRSLANLVAGRSRRGVRQTMDLQAAIELWRRHNLIVTEGDKKRWRVHSASPTFRESAGPEPDQLLIEGEFLQAGPDGKTWEVCLIRSGWSKNGRYYPAEMLEQHLHLFEGCPIAMYGWSPEGDAYLGHVPPHVRDLVPEGLVANITGWCEGVYGAFNERGEYEVRGTYHNEHDGLGRQLSSAWQRGQHDKLGFSIDALGETMPGTAEGRSGRIVTGMTVVHETTVVSNPAAGGRYLRLVAALENGGTDVNKLRQFLRAARLRANKDASGVDALQGKALCEAVMQEMGDAAALKAAKALLDAGNTEAAAMVLDAMIGELDGASAPPAPEAPPAEDAGGFLQMAQSQAKAALAEAQRHANDAAETARRLRLQECSATLTTKLGEAKIHDVAKAAIKKQFADRVFEPSELVEAIQVQLDIAAANATVQQEAVETATPVSHIGRVQVVLESRDKAEMALSLRLGYNPEKDKIISEAEYKECQQLGIKPRGITEAQRNHFRGMGRPPGIKEIYGRLTGDWNVTGRYGPGALCESTTTDFPNILGTSMERAMVQVFMELERYWDPLVSVNPNVDNFKTQDRILWHGFAELPTVAESASGSSYGYLGAPREEKTSYALAKKGGLFALTWEMFKNDDMNMLAEIPKKLARSAHHTTQNTVFKALIGALTNGTINADTLYDSVALYHDNHRNKKTAALSYSSLTAARQQLESQFERGWSTTINDSGGINSSDVTVTLTALTQGMPTAGGFYLQIEAEIVYISAMSGNDATIVRAQFGTTAASHADGTRVYQLARPLPIPKLFAVVPTELRTTLFEILASERLPDTANNNANFLKAEASAGRIIPVVVPTMYLGGDVNNWYLVGDPTMVPGIEVAFLDNRQEPEIFLQDAPVNGDVFKGDVITYKARYALAAKQVDFTGLQGNIVA